MTETRSAKIALLGSGVFAQHSYLPALLANTKDLILHTIWSRSSTSAVKLLDCAKSMGIPGGSGGINVLHGDGGLEAVLNNPDVDGVMLVLPITKHPELVLRALRAGKHVMSEKPVGKDVKTARETIEEYEKVYKPKGLIWRVAENWAHEPMLRKARDVIHNTPNLGPVLYWHLRAEAVVLDGSKYQSTEWRTVPDYQGGFILDGGVHSTALLRTVLPHPPKTIIAAASLHRTHLLPHDTVIALALPGDQATVESHGPPTALNAIRKREDVPVEIGRSSPQGTIFLSWAMPDIPEEHRQPNGITVTCLNGQVTVRQVGFVTREWVVTLTAARDSGIESGMWAEKWSGVDREVGMFARAVSAAKAGRENAEENFAEPRGALWDLAVIEACLTSNGNAVDIEKLIAGN